MGLGEGMQLVLVGLLLRNDRRKESLSNDDAVWLKLKEEEIFYLM